MEPIFKNIRLVLVLLLFSKLAYTQGYNVYNSGDGTIQQVNDSIVNESRLEGVILALSNNNQLNVKFTIPYTPINIEADDNTADLSPGFLFNLKMNIDFWRVQDYLTSSKTFITNGELTLNDYTKMVKVEYIPIPAGTDLDGQFKLAMIIQFNPADFSLEKQLAYPLIIVKISDISVTRI